MPLRTLLTIAIAPLAVGAAPPDAATYYVLTSSHGSVIGHVRQSSARTAEGQVRTSEQVVTVEAAGEVSRTNERSVTTENRAGEIVAFAQESRTGPSVSRIDAAITDRRATFVRSNRQERREAIVLLPPGVRFDSGSALIERWDPAITPRLEFDNLNLSAMTVEHVVIEPTTSVSAGGGERVAIRTRTERGEFRGIARLTIDRAG